MKTNEEILERYNSPETIDLFNIQKDLLLTLLPFELAKPYLDANYVASYDDLPEDEKWEDNFNAGEQLMLFLPLLHKLVSNSNFVEIRKGLLAVRTFIWVIDEEFFNEVDPFFSSHDLNDLDDFLKKVSKHFGYEMLQPMKG
jgi:predicted HAD superfamily phosphohydrolase